MSTETSDNTPRPDSWHVVRQASGHCDICHQTDLNRQLDSPKIWGPFASQADAMAKRVGLIRAGKCLPK
ncbi:MAG: DDE transposase family protein [Cyanobacteria bacterium P01_D01_bin.2]